LDGTRGSFITVYADCVRDGADRLHVDEATILSVTFAHEIGHLLLPRGHAFSGIMCGWPSALDWQRAERGGLLFNLRQIPLLRAAALARQQAALALAPED
jgi:hypothetical protein